MGGQWYRQYWEHGRGCVEESWFEMLGNVKRDDQMTLRHMDLTLKRSHWCRDVRICVFLSNSRSP